MEECGGEGGGGRELFANTYKYIARRKGNIIH